LSTVKLMAVAVVLDVDNMPEIMRVLLEETKEQVRVVFKANMPTQFGVEDAMKALVDEYWGKTTIMMPVVAKAFTVVNVMVAVVVAPITRLAGVKVGVTVIVAAEKPVKT
jgi:hypothetical protein